MTAELKEQIAKALATHHYANRFGQPEAAAIVRGNVDGNWGIFVQVTETALAAIEVAGYVVVPREPTREMIDAGMMMASCELADEYRAMVEAATKG